MRLSTVLVFMLVTRAAYGAFSVDLPIVTHTQGVSTVFYTALDVTNHTSQTTDVNFEYLSNDQTVAASGKLTSLGAYGNFHTDDILPYLASQNFITSAQASSFGTLLITFSNTTFTNGNEASVTARLYNYVNSGQKPSVGLAY